MVLFCLKNISFGFYFFADLLEQNYRKQRKKIFAQKLKFLSPKAVTRVAQLENLPYLQWKFICF